MCSCLECLDGWRDIVAVHEDVPLLADTLVFALWSLANVTWGLPAGWGGREGGREGGSEGERGERGRERREGGRGGKEGGREGEGGRGGKEGKREGERKRAM